MDDGYIIHQNKEYLAECLNNIRKICDDLGIVLNDKKTQIVKLLHGFIWLKAKIYLPEMGKVVKRFINKVSLVLGEK